MVPLRDECRVWLVDGSLWDYIEQAERATLK